jgi:hypothetical protein
MIVLVLVIVRVIEIPAQGVKLERDRPLKLLMIAGGGVDKEYAKWTHIPSILRDHCPTEVPCSMHKALHIQKNLINRFSEINSEESPTAATILEPQDHHPRHLNQFFTIAEHRKRQILEKMLMD